MNTGSETAIIFAALILIGGVAGVNLILTLAMIRRLRLMEERGGSGQDSDLHPLPSRGWVVPEFSVVDDLGIAVSRADLATGRRTVVVLTPTCTPCRELAVALASRVELDTLVFVLATRAESAELTSNLRDYRVIHTTEDWAEQVFQVTGYPAVLALSDGVVTSAGHKLLAPA